MCQQPVSQPSARGSNAVIGVINFVTFLISIPILAGGIWLSNRAGNTDCLRFLQWPLIVIGISLMVLFLMSFVVLWLYLFAMFFVVAALVGFVIFAFAVTDKAAVEILQACPYKRIALVWYVNCMLKFSNLYFFSVSDSTWFGLRNRVSPTK